MNRLPAPAASFLRLASWVRVGLGSEVPWPGPNRSCLAGQRPPAWTFAGSAASGAAARSVLRRLEPQPGPGQVRPSEYVLRFARDADIHDTEVPHAASLVTRTVRHHVSADALDEALAALPPGIRQITEPAGPLTADDR
ncbi:MAG TPA: DUF2267 domain-containing protein [Streptosporangiaceae bacterium]|nr:DUF2267 domain-containing protein [Streptosporangiaceae bacterium]